MIELSKKACKALDRWAVDGLYVYIRTTTTKWYRPDDDHRLLYSVTVEFRNAEWIIWDAKGDNLDMILRELGEMIPRRSKIHKGFVPADKEGTQIGSVAKAGNIPKLKKNKVYVEIRKSKEDKPMEKSKK